MRGQLEQQSHNNDEMTKWVINWKIILLIIKFAAISMLFWSYDDLVLYLGVISDISHKLVSKYLGIKS